MTTLQYLVGYVLHLNDNLAILAAHYGVWVYVILFLIIFCETGIVLAAFLPGDSLLFASGVVAASGGLNVYYLILILFLAAFIGNMINYQVGNMFGHFLFSNKNSKIFNHKHLKKTHIFYEKHGGKTIVLACFIPIIRTFAPFVAGMSEMTYKRFMFFNFFGVMFWMGLLIYGSYLFGNIPFVKNNFTYVIFAIIAVSLLPPVVEYLRALYKKRCKVKSPC